MIKYILLCFLILNSSFLFSQSFFTVGVNYSTLNGRQMPFGFGKQKLENFKLTPSIGYGYHFRINEKWSYEPGIAIGDLGGINIPDKPRTIYAIYAASLDQFIDYRPVPLISVGISPSVHYIAYAGITGKSLHVDSNGSVYSDEKLYNWKELPSHKLNRFVFSVVPRVSFHLKERWSIDLFYRSDLTYTGYPFRVLNSINAGYGFGANLKYQLKKK